MGALPTLLTASNPVCGKQRAAGAGGAVNESSACHSESALAAALLHACCVHAGPPTHCASVTRLVPPGERPSAGWAAGCFGTIAGYARLTLHFADALSLEGAGLKRAIVAGAWLNIWQPASAQQVPRALLHQIEAIHRAKHYRINSCVFAHAERAVGRLVARGFAAEEQRQSASGWHAVLIAATQPC